MAKGKKHWVFKVPPEARNVLADSTLACLKTVTQTEIRQLAAANKRAAAKLKKKLSICLQKKIAAAIERKIRKG